MNKLLPCDFDQQVRQAVERFWISRNRPDREVRQGGKRDAVTDGKAMEGFVDLIRTVASFCGFPEASVCVGKKLTVLPGFFRATKNWDLLVISQDRLIAVIECKSHVGSLGNNFNNRAEETIGSATDFWAAYHAAAFGKFDQITPPFTGYIILLEDTPEIYKSVKCSQPHFPILPAFEDASYAVRYRILCEQLMKQRLYERAAVLVSKPATEDQAETFKNLSNETSILAFFLAFAGRLMAEQPPG